MMRAWVIALLAVAGAARTAVGQVLEIVEAEACDVRLADGKPPTILDDAVLASGQKRVGNFWGERKGDEIRWEVNLQRAEAKLKLAVRYSYDHAHYQRMRGPTSVDRKLTLLIDGEEAGEVGISDTKSWHDFGSAYVELPKLARGKHALG